MTNGDGTVPILSAARNPSLNAPNSLLRQFTVPVDLVGHGELPQNPNVRQAILCALRNSTVVQTQQCMDGTPQSPPASLATQEMTEDATQTAYYVRVTGSPSVVVTDSYGNSTNPISDTSESGLPNLTSHVGDGKSVFLTIPTDQTYTVTIKSESDAIAIELTKQIGDTVAQAVRYLNVSVPAGRSASLRLDPQAVGDLRYDSDGDGIFETLIQPTASVTGVAAQDIDPPNVAINEVPEVGGSLITITASDDGSGVKGTFYSLNGNNYQPYTDPFGVDPAKFPIVYSFADDNVANRSSLVTYQLSSAVTLQLDSSGYAANEADGIATIHVMRLGNASGVATVNYATSDGNGKQQRDYIFAAGTLSFAAGETSKSFTVLLINNSYVDGDRNVNITLSNPAGASLGTFSTAALTIHDDDVALSPINPTDDPSFFVREHYYDFLNRVPDPSGLAFWTNEIASCGTDQACIDLKRINVSAAFYLSIEFQGTGYLVERIYKAAYGDAQGTSTFNGAHQLAVPIVRLNEFLPDTQAIGQGVVVNQSGWEQVLENNKQAFTAEFVQRSRFTTAFPSSMTPDQFVDALNANAGNPLSSAERNQLVNDLTTGAKTRAQVLRAVAEDQDLSNAEFNRAFVLMQYFGYLRRNPNDPQDSDYTGYDFWLTKLNQFNGNFVNADMVKALIVSAEYRQRFGP